MQLIAALSDLCKASTTPIIAIDGPAGSGKTTIAHDIFLAFAPSITARVIHMDDLYPGWSQALGSQLQETLEYIVTSHRGGDSYSLSFYDWKSEQFQEAVKYEPTQLLILEGVGAGQSAIRSELSALIWMDIDPVIGVERVLERDGVAIKDAMSSWLLQQEQHFLAEGTQNAADFILTT
jgi:uridine kinase